MRILIALALLSAPAMARDMPTFDPAPALNCLASDAAPDSCAGLAANACMEGQGGFSTVGMGFCLGAERDWWDDRLNVAYGEVLTRAKTQDAQPNTPDPHQAVALRDMQRAWIAFRDAACGYEAARWTGGTGAGPAAAQCLLILTARQANRLDGYLREGP
ncbi:lysozyme inhibitor LprI family protein [Paracoccus sp. Ld10]|uniref:lysozyme inhibitor LprI family protein n=1 Tax=Paracoccus sp. Ld10 TaxID=649158 RepID=UPI0038637748